MIGALVFILFFSFVYADFFLNKGSNEPKVFVGVDVAYGDENAVYNVTQAVAGYANLIILGSLNVTSDPVVLTRVCNYLYEKGFYFMIYVGFPNKIGFLPPRGPDPQFFNRTAGRWKTSFGGFTFSTNLEENN